MADKKIILNIIDQIQNYDKTDLKSIIKIISETIQEPQSKVNINSK